MPTEKQLNQYATNIKPSLVDLLKALQSDITDDMTDPNELDAEPYMQITIACNADLKDWQFQTGDNSFTGACYHRQNWGIGYLTKESDLSMLADDLINDMLEQVINANGYDTLVLDDQIADS